jgi:hypothetical protein
MSVGFNTLLFRLFVCRAHRQIANGQGSNYLSGLILCRHAYVVSVLHIDLIHLQEGPEKIWLLPKTVPSAGHVPIHQSHVHLSI